MTEREPLHRTPEEERGGRGVLPLVRRRGRRSTPRAWPTSWPGSSGRGGSSAAGRSRRSPACRASTRTSTSRSSPATCPRSASTSATAGTSGATTAAPCGPFDDRLPRGARRAQPGLDPAERRRPWVIDLPITPDRDGLWTSKRDPDHVAPLEDVTWVADDGDPLPAARGHAALQGALHRPKDDRDLASPGRCSTTARGLAARGGGRLYPGHAWLARTMAARLGSPRRLGRS